MEEYEAHNYVSYQRIIRRLNYTLVNAKYGHCDEKEIKKRVLNIVNQIFLQVRDSKIEKIHENFHSLFIEVVSNLIERR